MASAAILAGGWADMPFVNRMLLRYMVELVDNADIVIPLTERGYHPLWAIYTRACRAAVARRLERRHQPGFKRRYLRLTGLLDEVRIKVVEKRELERFGDTAHLLANVNTPAEFGELESLLGHKPKS